MDELAELRAALIQLAKALEIQRACVIRIQKLVEKEMEKPIPVNIKQGSMVLNESSR